MLISGNLFSDTVNGYFEEIEGKTVLRVKGTIQERGYAQGYLLGDNLRYLFAGYMLPMLYGNNSFLYNQTRSFFTANFDVEQKYIDESQAIIDGMTDAEVDLYVALLNREIDYIDLLMNVSIVDLIAVSARLSDHVGACSSISSWGSSTVDLPEIAGEQIITRHLDWSSNSVLRQNHIITVHFPSEDEYQNWVNIGIAGFSGALSAVNENRLGAFYNVGSNHTYSMGEQFQPILFAVRSAIEAADFNGDGLQNYQDIQSAFEEGNFISGSIIHTAALINTESFPVVFEVNNQHGVSVRTEENNDLNPVVPDNHLAATNHFRTLYNPTYCGRYQGISDSLQVNSVMSPERSWSLLSGAAGVNSNVQAMQYIPVTGELRWATMLYSGSPAHTHEPTLFDIDYLLTYDEETSIGGGETLPSGFRTRVSNFPNPFNPQTNISFTLLKPTEVELVFYNLKGQTVHSAQLGQLPAGEHNYVWDTTAASDLPSGIYLLKVNTGYDEQVHKMLMLK
jgi:hypothetical protein